MTNKQIAQICEQLSPAERLVLLKQLQEERAELDGNINIVADDVFNDVISGVPVGELHEDFALSICDGRYDPFVVQQYRDLQEYINVNDDATALFVQESAYCSKDGLYIHLRNFYLAQLRSAAIEFDINESLLGIPVKEGGYLVRRTMFHTQLQDIKIKDLYLSPEAERLYVGPLWNDYVQITRAPESGVSASCPTIAPCFVFVQPWNMQTLEQMEIDKEFFDDLLHTYMRAKTKALSL